MTHLFAVLLRLAIPTAFAQLDSVGSGDPSIVLMWAEIREIFPSWSVDVGWNAPTVIAARVVLFLFNILGGVAVLVLLYAGVRLVTSAGDEAAYGDAKKMAGYALAGVALAIASNRIILYACSYVVPLMTGGSFGECPVL